MDPRPPHPVPAPDGEGPGLRERPLGLATLTRGEQVRAQAYLFAAAGVVGALAVLLPHPERYHEPALLANQLAAIGGALLLLLLRERTPRWFVTAGPFLAALLTTCAIVATGSSTSAYVLFYLWVAFYAFYCLGPRRAAVLAGFALVNYVGVVIGFRALGDGPPSERQADIPVLVLTTGTLVCAGVFLMLLRDRLAQLIARLTDAAATDPLTGLLNRRGLHRSLEAELARHERTGRPFSLVLGDLDFFKRVNDGLGHSAGDDALVAVAQLLETHKRRIDVAARYGGEEFALVLPEADERAAYLVAERLREQVAERFAQDAIPLTMSFGVARSPDEGADADALLRAADDALYAAKALGRDRTVLWSSELEELLSERSAEEQGRDETRLASVIALAEALDMRDEGTARHSQTVAGLCELMARELGLPPRQVARVRIAGTLHDIGKIAVPDAVLRKPGALDELEWEQMRKHPEAGARLLEGSGLDDIREWVLCHHERPDGRGYPRGLAGDEVPLEARIVAVADAYEAMTSDRVYRRSIGAHAARRELRQGSGSQFDPEVVSAFLRALDRAGSRAAAATRA